MSQFSVAHDFSVDLVVKNLYYLFYVQVILASNFHKVFQKKFLWYKHFLATKILFLKTILYFWSPFGEHKKAE